jgi:hypothetical protein
MTITIKRNEYQQKKQQTMHGAAQNLPHSVTKALDKESTYASPAFTVDNQSRHIKVTIKTSTSHMPNHAQVDGRSAEYYFSFNF